MKTVHVVLMGLLLATALAMASLLTPAHLAFAQTGTPVSGTISANTTWAAANSPYIVTGNITVPQNVTLTIEPGVNVRFSANTRLTVNSGGTLLAESSGAAIIFTTNATLPARGDWYGLLISNGGAARLSNCEIVSGGGSFSNAGLEISSSNVQVRGCSIRESGTAGIYLGGTAISPVLENLRIENNTGIAVEQASFNMTPAYTNLTIQNNGTDAVSLGSGTLGGNHTLNSVALNGKPFRFTGNASIALNVTLTIAPSTTIFMPASGSLTVNNGATLLAEGTADQRILWTSSSTSPGRGDWNRVLISSGATVRLNFCEIAFAGGGNIQASLEINSSNVEVRNCLIRNGNSAGIYLNGNGISPLLENLRLENNAGLAVEQAAINVAPVYNNLVLRGNGTDAVSLGGGTLDRNFTLDGAVLNGKPFRLASSTFVATNATLVISPSTILQMVPAGSLNFQSGSTLDVRGTPTQPVVITSSSTTPKPGDWRELQFSSGATVRMNHCEIAYGGGSTVSGAIEIFSSNVEIRNCRLHDHLNSAIYVSSNAQPVITDNIISNNAFGLRNVSFSTEVDARGNSWGHPSGPNHPTTNPQGQGNAVSDRVRYAPWSEIQGDTEPPTITTFSVSSAGRLVSSRELVLTTVVNDVGSGPGSLFFAELVFSGNPASPWRVVQESGWRPYAQVSTNFNWTITNDPGVHYLLVLAADNTGNISTAAGADFVSYQPAQTTISAGQVRIYRVRPDAGSTRISLTPTPGSIGLYIFGADGALVASDETDTTPKQLVFNAAGGFYQLEVDGYTAGTYSLSLTPGPGLSTGQDAELVGRPRGTAFLEPGTGPTAGNVSVPEPPRLQYTYLPTVIR